MDCNRIMEYITLLADEEIDDFNREAVLEHIKTCASCFNEYTRILSMKQLLSKDSYLSNLKSKHITTDVIDTIQDENIRKNHKDYKQKLGLEWIFMKKGLVSACIAIILIACLFIPFNEKSFAKSMENWIKQINFKYTSSMQNGTTAEVNHSAVVDQDQKNPLQFIYDERDEALAKAENITDPAEKQKKIDEILNKTQIKLEEKRATDFAKLLEENTIIDYASIEEAKSNITIAFPTPDYIPEGYVLDKVTFIKHNSGIQEMVKFTYKPVNISENEEFTSNDYLSIGYILETFGTQDPSINEFHVIESYNKNTDIEEISVLNNPGYILKEINSRESKFFMSINAFCQNYRANVAMSMHSANIDSDMELVRSEIVKVMESFISQQ